MKPASCFTTNDLVAKIPGLTLRMVQWWDEIGVIAPTSKDGHMRQYTLHEAVCIAICYALRRKGIHLFEVRKLIKRLMKPDFAFDQTQYLLTDRSTFRVLADRDEMLELIKKSRSGMHLVSIGDQINLLAR